MNNYLNAIILEMFERAGTMKAKIPTADKLFSCFNQLAIGVTFEIDRHVFDLKALQSDTIYQRPSNLPFKLNKLQNIIRELDYLENTIIAAINRSNVEDESLTNFVQKICHEIKYPLVPPVVSRLSQEYYCIDTKFNHLRTPLLEADFLLHMPDLYHELCHPLISARNDHRVTEFQKYLVLLLIAVNDHFERAINDDLRNNRGKFSDLLETFRQSWVENWAVEFFCDLFGTFTVGPAYAWANLHLCIKTGYPPYETPINRPSTHPADHARMDVILQGLKLVGFANKVQVIEDKWKEYLNLINSVKDANFKMAYPINILELCVIQALQATKSLNCQIVSPVFKGEVFLLLNEAWEKFTANPKTYFEWEAQHRKHISHSRLYSITV